MGDMGDIVYLLYGENRKIYFIDIFDLEYIEDIGDMENIEDIPISSIGLYREKDYIFKFLP